MRKYPKTVCTGKNDPRIVQSFLKDEMLDFGIVEDYAAMFKSGAKFLNMIQMEVL